MQSQGRVIPSALLYAIPSSQSSQQLAWQGRGDPTAWLEQDKTRCSACPVLLHTPQPWKERGEDVAVGGHVSSPVLGALRGRVVRDSQVPASRTSHQDDGSRLDRDFQAL